jgi:hemolysin D
LTLIEEEHSVGHIPGDPSGEMQVEGRTAQLAPGMSVTVEIKTGSRRIISYLLSPLMRYKQEILRER